MSKPADADSDDDEPLANIQGGKSASQKANERAQAEEAEIALVQKRLAAAHLGEGQLEALQDKQRIRIERHNSYRSQSIHSGRSATANESASGSGHLKDLMDLNFDEEAANQSGQTMSSSSRPSNAGASLSDYSDYESESDEDAAATAHRGGGQHGDTTATDRWSSSRYKEEDHDDGWAPTNNHRPNIGPDSLLQDDDDDDPFADPQDKLESFTPLRATGPRRDYTAV